jgi:hypothetical protein
MPTSRTQHRQYYHHHYHKLCSVLLDVFHLHTRVYPKVSGLAALSEWSFDLIFPSTPRSPEWSLPLRNR